MVFNEKKMAKLTNIFKNFIEELGKFQQLDLTKKEQKDPSYNYAFNKLVVKFLEVGVGKEGLIYHLIGLLSMASKDQAKENLMDTYFKDRVDLAREKNKNKF